MAKDDYFCIVYKLLQILYEDLKKGVETDLEAIINDTKTFPINQRYWIAIFEDLLERDYIKGVYIISVANSNERRIREKKTKIRITAEGVEYLQNNSTMAKMRDAFGTVKDFIPMAASILAGV